MTIKHNVVLMWKVSTYRTLSMTHKNSWCNTKCLKCEAKFKIIRPNGISYVNELHLAELNTNIGHALLADHTKNRRYHILAPRE
uniref:Uncharacterized protein n=1 Tax=Aegilops tauschii subsp. strangulata TaxID=200361 RepID=A0A453ETQ6_AEGTS